MGKGKDDQQLQETMRILATQIETINQQLSAGGVASGPALPASFDQLEQKLSYLYEFMKGMQQHITDAEQEYFDQVGKRVTTALNTNLTQLFGKLQELHGSLEAIKEALRNSPQLQANDILEMKQTLQTLIGVYKDEVTIFKEQNEYLQKKLSTLERKLDLLAPSKK